MRIRKMLVTSLFIVLLAISAQFVNSKFSMDECGKTKGCLFKPDNCVAYENCAYVFTYSMDPTSNTVFMEIFGEVLSPDNAYLAVGFSHDNEMGNDTVTDCSSFDGTPFIGRLSYNPGKSNLRVPLNQSYQDSILTTVSAEYQDGTLYCQLIQKIVPLSNVLPMFVAPLDKLYYILLASGRTTSLYSHPELSVHTLNESSVFFPYVSPYPIDMQRFKRSINSIDLDTTSNSGSGSVTVPLDAQNDEPSPVINQNQQQSPLMPDSGEGPTRNNLNRASWVPTFRQYPQTSYPSYQQNQYSTGTPYSQRDPSINPTSGQYQRTDGSDVEAIPPRNVQNEIRLMTAHAICMVLALIFFLSNGILWASQYRLVFPKAQIFGLQLWFHIHRTLNIIAVGLTIAGFVCVFTAKDWQWIGPKAYATTQQNQKWGSVHAMLGILTCCVVWFQPLLAVWRCHPHSVFRIIYRLLHGFLGYGAWLMGAAAIMIACVHFKPMFLSQPAAMGLFIAFVAVSGLVIIILTLMSMVRWCKIRRTTVSHEIEMKEINGKHETAVIPEEVTKDRGLRIAILLFYIIVSVGIAVAISTLIGLRCRIPENCMG